MLTNKVCQINKDVFMQARMPFYGFIYPICMRRSVESYIKFSQELYIITALYCGAMACVKSTQTLHNNISHMGYHKFYLSPQCCLIHF